MIKNYNKYGKKLEAAIETLIGVFDEVLAKSDLPSFADASWPDDYCEMIKDSITTVEYEDFEDYSDFLEVYIPALKAKAKKQEAVDCIRSLMSRFDINPTDI